MIENNPKEFAARKRLRDKQLGEIFNKHYVTHLHGSRTARFRAEKDKAREENPKEFTKRK